MDTLNTDCLLRIFIKLDFTSRVRLETLPCAFSDITKLDASRYVQPTTSNYFQQDTIDFEPKIVGILRRCGPTLREIGFGSRWLRISQPIIDHIAKYCQQLTRLDLGCVILNADISPILRNVAQKLEYFSLEESSWIKEEHALKVNYYLGRMKSLIRLNLRKFVYSLDNIVGVSYNLEIVDLSGTRQLSLKVLGEFLSSHVNLKEVTICPFPNFHCQHSAPPTTKFSGLEGDDPELLQTAIDAFKELNALTFLSLGHIRKDFLSLKPLAELTNLRVLHIQDCKCIDSGSLKHILTRTNQLRILSLVDCPRIEDYSSLSRCTALCELEIRHTTQLSDHDVDLLAQNGMLKRFRLEKCNNITNKSIVTLVCHCPLIELELSKCENIGEDLFALKPVWNNMRINILSLNGTSAITNHSVAHLSEANVIEQIRELDLSYIKNVDDSAIRRIHDALNDRKLPIKRKALIIYVSHTGVTQALKKEVHPEIELVF
ncbi:F-box/LRR-repeat protein 2 [Ditylenchus destructor]|nr:F-box/LRR-repeat protein 2 [Ditylenchus destructor]